MSVPASRARRVRSPECCAEDTPENTGKDTPAPLPDGDRAVTHNAQMRRFPLALAVWCLPLWDPCSSARCPVRPPRPRMHPSGSSAGGCPTG
jgi:hypothetical protein